jgi:hypothetical protein
MEHRLTSRLGTPTIRYNGTPLRGYMEHHYGKKYCECYCTRASQNRYLVLHPGLYKVQKEEYIKCLEEPNLNPTNLAIIRYEPRDLAYFCKNVTVMPVLLITFVMRH